MSETESIVDAWNLLMTDTNIEILSMSMLLELEQGCIAAINKKWADPTGCEED